MGQQNDVNKRIIYRLYMLFIYITYCFIDHEFATNLEELQKENITHIINCAPEECENLFCNQIKYIDIQLKDKDFTQDEFRVIQVILEFINDAVEKMNGKVLICSKQGISRSPTIALAYLIHKKNISLQGALKYLREIYPKAEPNIEFEIQLQEFSQQEEDRIRQENSETEKRKKLEQLKENRRQSIKNFVDNNLHLRNNNNHDLLLGITDLEEKETLKIKKQRSANISDFVVDESELIESLNIGDMRSKSQIMNNNKPCSDQELLDQKKQIFLQKAASMSQCGNQNRDQIIQMKHQTLLLEQQKQLMLQQQQQLQQQSKEKKKY